MSTEKESLNGEAKMDKILNKCLLRLDR